MAKNMPIVVNPFRARKKLHRRLGTGNEIKTGIELILL